MANFEITKLTAAVLLAAMCACSKQEDGNVTIKASLPEDAKQKVSLESPVSGSGMTLRWEAGDKLSVEGAGTSIFTICDGFTDHEAEFSGTTVSGSSFNVLYPGDRYRSTADILARSYEGQVQNGNRSTAHLQWTAMLEGVADYSHLNFSKGKRSGVLSISAMLPDDVASVRSITVSAKTPLFYLTNDASAEKSAELKLDLAGVDLTSDHTLEAFMMTSWEDMPLPAGEVITVTIVVDDTLKYIKRLTVPAGGLVIRSGSLNLIKLYGDAAGGNLNTALEGFIWTDDNFWN